MTAAVLLALAVFAWPPRGGGVIVEGSRPRWAAVWEIASVWRVRLPFRRPAHDGRWVADLAEVVAVGLDAGLDLTGAVLAAARSPSVVVRAPWLVARVEQALASGHPVSSCLDPPAPCSGDARRDLDLLVAAWRLAEDAGAPSSAVTSAAARAVRERRASRERAEVAVAGPRTSMWVLTALPLAGPVGGLLVGFGPDRLYASTAARAAATVGVLLTVTGWLWARAVLARAARPATTGAPS